MRRYLAIILSVLPLAASAQTPSLLDRFYASLADSCVEFVYNYSARVSGLVNRGEGVLMSQGSMWSVKGNGVEMYCDSETLWVVDPMMKEVVIEPASSEGDSAFLDNPALMFSRLSDNFKVTESRPLESGKLMMYTLRPLSDIGIIYFNVELENPTSQIKRASFAMSDGTLVKIEVSSMKLTPEVSLDAFKPVTAFGSDWIVTDLR